MTQHSVIHRNREVLSCSQNVLKTEIDIKKRRLILHTAQETKRISLKASEWGMLLGKVDALLKVPLGATM